MSHSSPRTARRADGHLDPRPEFAQPESPAAEASASRQRLADALQAARAARAALIQAERCAADLVAAQAAVPPAEEAFDSFRRESAIDLTEGTEAGRAERERLAAIVRSARERVKDLSTASHDVAQLGQTLIAADQVVRAAHLAIIEEEGMRLAAIFLEQSNVALQAERAVQVLAQWSQTDGDALMGVRLRAAVRPFPEATPEDRGRFQRAFDAHNAKLDAFGATWTDLPARLMNDPMATAPSPLGDA